MRDNPRMERLRIATRKSPLALWQTEHVAARLRAAHPGLDVALVPMSTRGDEVLDRSLAAIGGKGLFLKELELAMQRGEADCAVHSLKDVPMDLEPGFALPAILARADHAEAFVSARFDGIDALPPGARVGTSSLRRQAQLRLPTQRRRADARALRQRFDAIETVADEGIGMVGAGQDRRQREARLQFHRHVLQRVHRAIRVAALHRQFQFLEEQALAADRRERTVQHFVAAGAQRHQLDREAGMGGAQAVGDMLGLPEGERALAGGDAQRGHARIIAAYLPPLRNRGRPAGGGASRKSTGRPTPTPPFASRKGGRRFTGAGACPATAPRSAG